MNRVRWAWSCAALVLLGLTAAPARTEQPPMNRLKGVVVYRADGRPAANVPVVLAHGGKGYISILDGLQCYGEEEKVLGIFTKRNSKRACQTVTDAKGRFLFENFAAPDEAWNVAAGDPQHGFALRLDIHPKEYANTPLKIEIDKPAFLSVTPPPSPAKPYELSLGIAVLRPAAEDKKENAASSDEDEGYARVYCWDRHLNDVASEKPIRLGPLPSGITYRIVASIYTHGLAYQPMIAARNVTPAAGATAELSLAAPKEGAALTGRLTDAEDKPLANVNVRIKAADGMILGALTNAEGKYELRGVPAGTHQLELLRHAARRTPG